MNSFIKEQTIELAKNAGRFIRDAAANFTHDKIEHKGLNDLVSYVDKQAEQILVEGCRKILPEAGFITEEGTASKKGDRYAWIIDPLDGTTNFIHGLPAYAVSIGLAENDVPIMGIVYEINRDEVFHAIKGDGAFCNEERISVSSVAQLDGSLLATGFPYYEFSKMEKYLKILNTFMQKTHGIRRVGSAAVDLAYTACGRFEGFFEYNLNAWDVAAGIVLVEEAGGIVSDFSNGKDFVFGRELIAGTPGVQQAMQKIIYDIWTSPNE